MALAGLSERVFVADPHRSGRPAGSGRVHIRRGLGARSKDRLARVERRAPSDQGVNVATPVWGSDNLLFVSSAYNGGSRVLRLSRLDSGPAERGKVRVEEIWANRRVRVHFGNAVRIGTRVFASNGDFGAAPFAAIDIATGDMVWRDRSVSRATLIAVGGSLLILDEDGTLALATPNDTGLMIRARAAVLTGRAWTAPALSGTTLYLRDLKQIVALELGK